MFRSTVGLRTGRPFEMSSGNVDGDRCALAEDVYEALVEASYVTAVYSFAKEKGFQVPFFFEEEG